MPSIGHHDPLDLGGLLADAFRVEQLTRQGTFAGGELLENLPADGLGGLARYARQGELRRPAAALAPEGFLVLPVP